MSQSMIEPEASFRDTEPVGSVAYVVLLAIVAALGGLLFGYDTAVIAGAIGFLETHFELDAVWKGWAVASALLGCIAGAGLAGTISDRFGRKKAMVVAAVLFGVSAVGSAIPRDLTEFVIARIIGGVGVGMASVLSPLYIAEVSPARMRGRLVSVNQLAIVFGMLVVYFVNSQIAGLHDETWNVTMGWRWMFGSETLPAIFFLLLLIFVPESPRWLAKQGRNDESLGILTRVNGPKRAKAELGEITDAIAHEGGSIWQLLHRGMRIPLIIGICLAILQQITGINTIIYYAPEIFKSAGLVTTEAINDTVIIGAVNMLFTLVAIWGVDKIGRKPLLLIASAGMGLSLFLLGGAFIFEKFEGKWVLACILLYIASFASAMGPIVWVVIAEIFPTKIRGRAVGLAIVFLWIANFCVCQFFPIMLEKLQGYAFFVYGSMCVVAFLFIAACVPETKGKTLEEIEKTWMKTN